jgi:hypothetical protein
MLINLVYCKPVKEHQMNGKRILAAWVVAGLFASAASADQPLADRPLEGDNLAARAENRPMQAAGRAAVDRTPIVVAAPFAGRYVGDYGYRSRSSTAFGDALQGAGELFRGAGEAIRNTSEAAINIETAKSQNLRNNYEASKTFWEKRLLWSENTAYHRGRPLSSEQLRQIARDAAPARLSVIQLSPATGEINWPAGLLRPEFDDLRAKLEEVFANRTVSNSGIGSSTEVVVTRLTNSMQQDLKAKLREMTTNEYIVAKSFLRSLAYEARFMPGAEHVAQR